MKTVLLFPPTWHPSQPYLSLPSLTGFLKQGGVNDVIQRVDHCSWIHVAVIRQKGTDIAQPHTVVIAAVIPRQEQTAEAGEC